MNGRNTITHTHTHTEDYTICATKTFLGDRAGATETRTVNKASANKYHIYKMLVVMVYVLKAPGEMYPQHSRSKREKKTIHEL